MLQNFSVKGFRNFNDWYNFSLTTKKHYEFNSNSIKNGIVNNSIIYGSNGCGKSNLGLAILDLALHINDIPVMNDLTTNYLNNDNKKNSIAEFLYEFKFGNDVVKYEYGKDSPTEVVYEKLSINDYVVIELDRRKSEKLDVNITGTETLNKDLSGSNISAIKYIKSNSVFNHKDKTSDVFKKFIEFVSGMVFFRTLTSRAEYSGQQLDGKKLSKKIIDSGNLPNFEKFINEAGVECKLELKGDADEERIVFKYKNSTLDFLIAASTGTMSLGLFYYWWLKLDNEELTFAYIDEFDAYYHHSLARLIVNKLIKVNCQIILTTHNLSIMSNDLLRPDCYFLMADKQYPFHELVDKDLRKAHNLEKIYKGLKYETKE